MIYLNLTDAGKAIDYYEKAFGQGNRPHCHPDGKILDLKVSTDMSVLRMKYKKGQSDKNVHGDKP